MRNQINQKMIKFAYVQVVDSTIIQTRYVIILIWYSHFVDLCAHYLFLPITKNLFQLNSQLSYKISSNIHLNTITNLARKSSRHAGPNIRNNTLLNVHC